MMIWRSLDPKLLARLLLAAVDAQPRPDPRRDDPPGAGDAKRSQKEGGHAAPGGADDPGAAIAAGHRPEIARGARGAP